MGDLTSVAAGTWAHTPSSIELTSLLAQEDESEADAAASDQRSRDGDEMDDTKEDERAQELHEELEKRDAALD